MLRPHAWHGWMLPTHEGTWSPGLESRMMLERMGSRQPAASNGSMKSDCQHQYARAKPHQISQNSLSVLALQVADERVAVSHPGSCEDEDAHHETAGEVLSGGMAP